MLGGHSLLATRMVARVRDELGYELPLRAVFAAPTVAELAHELREHTVQTTAVPLQRRQRTSELPPLSWAQQRLWFLDQLEPDSAAYSLHWAARLDGHLKPAALQTAIDCLTARHEVLRTRFVSHAGEPVQVIAPQVDIGVQYDTLWGATEARLSARILELIRQPFDLSSGPLLRVHVLRLADDAAVLLLVMHHIVSDGWSMGVLFDELASLYDAAVQGRNAELPELPVQYADYAVWQRQWLSGAELDRQVGYWSEQLAAAPPLLELPLDHPRPPVQRYRGAWVNRTLQPRAVAGPAVRWLVAKAARLFMVLLAAFKVLLGPAHRHRGHRGGHTDRRAANAPSSKGLIGFFLNTLALAH